MIKKPELLAPAGNLEKMKMALLYGADAVYLGGKLYGLRALGVQGLAVDLTLYVLTMAGGFLLDARLSRSGPARRLTGVSLLAVMLYGAALVLFTFADPPLGIFRP